MLPRTVNISKVVIIYSSIYLGTDERKHQSSASLAFVRGIHRSPVNSPQKGPITRKMFQLDDVVIMTSKHGILQGPILTPTINGVRQHQQARQYILGRLPSMRQIS